MIQEIIDKVVRDENEANKRKPSISPSNLGTCLRQLILMENDYPHDEFDDRTLRVFRVGYLFESFATEALRKSGKLLKEQTKVEYRGMKGTLDWVIEYDGKPTLCDNKTVHSYKFDWLDKEGIDKKYIYQLGFYHAALKQTMPDLNDNAVVFYIEKECLLTKEMMFNALEQKDAVDEKLDEIEQARAKFFPGGMLPPEKEVRDWECFSFKKKKDGTPYDCKKWCRWMRHCQRITKEYEETLKLAVGNK